MTQPTPDVRPGQIWADNDPRSAGRHLKVIEVDTTHATMELVTPRGVGHHQAKPGRRTRSRLNRFRPTSTGYRLVTDVPAGVSR